MKLPKLLLRFCGLFEAELLLQLMLRYWRHPLADDADFRNDMLEGTVDALQASVNGQPLIEDVPPADMSFVAAAWYVEFAALDSGAEDLDGLRKAWLEAVRKAVPSCFCPQNRLR